MRLHLISDLHLEGRYLGLPDVEADITCVCGDLGHWSKPKLVIDFLNQIERPVYLVLGNHDFYHTDSQDLRHKDLLSPYFKAALQECPHVTLLHNEATTLMVGGQPYEIYGTPLWSGLTISLDPDLRQRIERDGLRLVNPLNPLVPIQVTPPGGLTEVGLNCWLTSVGVSDFSPNLIMRDRFEWTPARHIEAHQDAVMRLTGWLRRADRAMQIPTPKRIVLTHWIPSEEAIAPKFRGHWLNPYFCAPLDDLIYRTQPDLWCFGHTHTEFDFHIDQTRLVANPRGYRGETNGFNPGLVLTV